jgi:hypothetical protein
MRGHLLKWGHDMEDKVQALALELATLKTTLNTSIRWLGILGAFLIGGLGVTNFFSIPSFINSAFVEKGGQGLIDKLAASEKSAAASSANLKTAADTIGGITRSPYYVCPSITEQVNAAWVTWGCVGQVSQMSKCTNYWWSGGGQSKSYDCQKVVFVKVQ